MQLEGGLTLSPYRVLDLTDEKGLFCGKILGDLGADVIKVEKPGGDPARNIGPFYHDTPHPEKSLFWFAYNTSKRGITLNIETKEGQEVFKRLVKTADFVIESFPPGYLDKLGLDYSVLSEINPRIIMTSITPFGQTGPYKDYKASDIVCMAMGGWMYVCGDEDLPPVRFSVEQAYLQGSTQAAVGTLIAHYYREMTGEGQHIDVSIEECVVWTLTYTVPYWDIAKRLFTRAGIYQKRMDVVYRRLYPCKDGYVSYMLGFGSMIGPMHSRLVEAMDEEGLAGGLKEVDWKSLSWEAIPQETIKHWEETMLNYFMNHTKAELQDEALKRNSLLCVVNSPKDVMEYQQLQARGYWAEVQHPELPATITYPGFFFKSTEASSRITRRAPLIGEHNIEIYQKELGFTIQELSILKEGNII